MGISTDFSLNYDYKYIYHSTSGTTVYSVNELYSWLMDELDESGTIDNSVPMTAQTPTAYTLTNGWYINEQYYQSFQYLNGGSIQTLGWDGSSYADGIRLLTFNAGGYVSAIEGDIGKIVTDGTDTGRLLDFNNTTRTWWVRQDSTDDNFLSGGTVTITSGTGTGTLSANGITGESMYTNLYTIGSLQNYTRIYVYQNGLKITPWWGTGHIDILLKTKEAGSLIDTGLVTIFARQYTKLYDHYLADLSDGNRTPIPLATFNDTNNPTAAYSFTFGSGNGTFTVGEVIQANLDATKQGIIVTVTHAGTNPNKTGTITYYLNNTTQFVNGDAITGQSSGMTATLTSTITDLVASYSDITLNFASVNRDLLNGAGLQPYDVEIDCNYRPLNEVYQYLKFLTRGGSLTAVNSINGEAYIAASSAYDPVKSAPFGTYAGGKFFGARGVWLKNVFASDANNYELIDANNIPQRPPATIAINVTLLEVGDKVSVFRTTGNNEFIDREIYHSHASNNTAGTGTFEVQETIASDTPSSGFIRVIDNSLNREQRYPFSSWTNTPSPVFTLDSITLDRDYEATDTAYVPYIDGVATSDTISQSVTYDEDRYVLTVVRYAGRQPFKIKGQITSTGMSAPAVRNPDSIYQV